MPDRPATHKPKRLATPPRPKKQDRRESSTKRGYDFRWQRLRAAVLAESPLCTHCLARGEYVTATDVDHVIPFKGKHDPKRLDTSNLQALCSRCHDLKSWRDGTKGKVHE